MKKVTLDAETIFAGVLVILGFAVWLPAAVILNGWAFQTLWAWFIAEPFGVARLGMAHAIGLSFLIAHACNRTSDGDKKGLLVWLGKTLIGPPLVVGIGWIIHYWM